MRAKALMVGSLLVGCGASGSSTPAPDATSDAADTGITTDSGFVLDTGAPDTGFDATACPDVFPGTGATCTALGTCEYDDTECGGKLQASCASGLWSIVSRPACGPFCPPTKPADGASCTSFPTGRVCAFWPGATDVCTSCTCTDGSWVCTSPVTCAYTRLGCKPGTACTANTGCGAGKCNYFCVCGVDGALHCTANPC